MKILEKYIARTIFVYFILAWTLLTAILFVQQSNRFTELLLNAVIPMRLLLELSGALILTVLSFTAPMAILVGVVVGIGQLRGDSEVVALFAAGFSRRTILVPALLNGVLIVLISFAVNIWGVPLAAKTIRQVTRAAALIKLDSPIEPKVFNTEFNNNVIYVREADKEKGLWKKIFIYAPDPHQQNRLITAEEGRIDASAQKSELVLFNAVVTTLPNLSNSTDEKKQITVENLSALRLSLGNTREQVLKQLQKIEKLPEEMSLSELASFAVQKSGREKNDLLILWHRRVALAIAPLILALLGVSISLKFNRSGRGLASVLALIAIIAYYLLTLLGEQLVRTNLLPAFLGSWLATATAFLASWWWLRQVEVLKSSLKLNLNFFRFKTTRFNFFKIFSQTIKSNLRRNNLMGLLERDVLYSLLKNFFLITFSLWALFLVFTVFELFRSFIVSRDSVIQLLKYLFFLTPMVLLQVGPSALMLSVLITYALKVRNNEVVVWGAAGQSSYVLLIPCFLLALALALIGWEWQEQILPKANQKQDALRAQLKGEGIAEKSSEGRFWVASTTGIYSFVTRRQVQNEFVKDVSFFQFNTDQTHLAHLYKAANGVWENNQVVFTGNLTAITWRDFVVEINHEDKAKIELARAENPFDLISIKTSHLNTNDLEKLANNADSPVEKRRLQIALQKKYASIFLFFVTVFFSAPLALSLRSRQTMGQAIALSIVIWLTLMATISIFDKLGGEGFLPPGIAVWAPLIIFSSLGLLLLARLEH